MSPTKIEWATDTINPVIGCSRVSAGCEHCYAERMAARLARMPQAAVRYRGLTKRGRWTGEVRWVAGELEKSRRWKKPKRVFVGSMGDVFHPGAPGWAIMEILYAAYTSPRHTFILLTKRAEIMEARLREQGELPPNLWVGITAENQATADERIPHLLATQAAVRFVSVEPMLGPVVLPRSAIGSPETRCNDRGGCGMCEAAIHLVICGCESGPGRRETRIEWVRSLRDQCVAAGVPFFLKQLDIGGKVVKMPALDGRVWDQIPGVSE